MIEEVSDLDTASCTPSNCRYLAQGYSIAAAYQYCGIRMELGGSLLILSELIILSLVCR